MEGRNGEDSIAAVTATAAIRELSGTPSCKNNEDDLEWDPSKCTVTAWSTAAKRGGRVRRTYSRRGSNDQGNNDHFSSGLRRPRKNSRTESCSSFENFDSSPHTSFSSEISESTTSTNYATTIRQQQEQQQLKRRTYKTYRRTIPMSAASLIPPLPKPHSLGRSYSTTARFDDSSSQRDVSSSSSMSDSFLFDISSKENDNPNYDSYQQEAPTSMFTPGGEYCNKRKKTRARRNSISMINKRRHPAPSIPPPLHRRSSASDVSNLLFSDLAKSDSALTWLKPSSDSPTHFKSPGVDFDDLTDATASSPARSVATSVESLPKKRYSCNSPCFDDIDDMSSAGRCFSASLGFASNHRHLSESSTPAMSICETRTPPIRSDSFGFKNTGRKTVVVNLQKEGEDQNSNATDESSVDTTSNLEKSDSYLLDAVDDDSEDGDDDNCDAFIEPKPLPTPTLVRSERDVLSSMPSKEDLVFLVNTLREEQRVREAYTQSGLSSICWNIVLPCTWESERRSTFIKWASKKLGFTVRAAGGAFSYLQTSRTKGSEVFTLLESALMHYEEQENASNAVDRCLLGESCDSMDIGSVCKANQFNVSDDCRDECYTSGERMPLNPGQLSFSTFLSYDNDTTQLTAGLESLTFSEKKKTNNTPLVRHVTMEPAVPNISEICESPGKDCNRPSLESHVGPQDLMFHLHGLSPVGETMKPSKMSLSSVSSVRSNFKQCDSTPYNPAINISGQCNLVNNLSLDFVETPMVKQSNQGWGSRPLRGRDWGGSERCSESIIGTLTRRLKEACHDSGLEKLQIDSSSLFTRSSDLGFDLEVGCDENPDIDEVTNLGPAVGKSRKASFQSVRDVCDERKVRKRKDKIAKHRRMSLWNTATNAAGPLLKERKSLFRSGVRLSIECTDRSGYPNLASNNDFFPSIADNTSEFSERSSICTLEDSGLLTDVFSFLEASELLTKVSLVSASWANAATSAYAQLMLVSVGCSDFKDDGNVSSSVAASLEKSWQYLVTRFPTASFLSEGAFKRVYKVQNMAMSAHEAISVMDVDMIESTGNKSVVSTELAVSAMLSSLSRRGICPNFVITREIFTCPYEPPESHWGSSQQKKPSETKSKSLRRPREPSAKRRGHFQYMRMELCSKGDAEGFLKEQPNEAIDPKMARNIVFQLAFALHAAADRFSLKHYDVKLLNVFLQETGNIPSSAVTDHKNVVLRYGLGAHTFSLKMSKEKALVAKLADYGTADVKAESNGQHVTIAQFTTLENSPPDYLIHGDEARQGHGHDCFGLGLSMFHLFTGHAPYEEILSDVKCPNVLKEKLRNIWENEESPGYTVIRSVILSDVYKDDVGNIVEGEPDETLYDTLYRYLVLFGIPSKKTKERQYGRVWRAIEEALEGTNNYGRRSRRKKATDVAQFSRDRRKFSLSHGSNKYVARARENLEAMDGGMDLLLSLISFDPNERFSALDVLNCSFMEPLREKSRDNLYRREDKVFSYTALSTTDIISEKT